jgi:hypothetical protein
MGCLYPGVSREWFFDIKQRDMKSFRYNAARGEVGVICRRTGLVEANYSGPLSSMAFGTLRGEMIGATNTAPASVIRLDRSLILASAMPDLPPGKLDAMPGCLIVRRDQYDVFQDYATRLSKQGAIRLVFLDEYAHLAYDWALRRCAERQAQ